MYFSTNEEQAFLLQEKFTTIYWYWKEKDGLVMPVLDFREFDVFQQEIGVVSYEFNSSDLTIIL
jgi:hypothetical protein